MVEGLILEMQRVGFLVVSIIPARYNILGGQNEDRCYFRHSLQYLGT
jgi:hypothetical protein